jgi:viroplasmin and RNaseH domain-containing protein
MTGRETAGIFKTWKGKNRNHYFPEGKKQESLRPGRKKEGIFKTWKAKNRNI